MNDPLVRDVFLEPVVSLIDNCHHSRDCPSLSDHDFVRFGIERCIYNDESGRDFLQSSIMGDHDHQVSRSDYFEQLSSPRRGRLIEELEERLEHLHRRKLLETNDAFSCLPELDGIEIVAGDGHLIEHATHDQKRFSSKKDSFSYVPVTHFYLMDLRTGWLELLDSSTEMRRKHDMTAIKSADPKKLSRGKKGTIIVWDRAAIDFKFWEGMKRRHGTYFISMKKENFNIQKQGELQWDRDDAKNMGVISDEYVGINQCSYRLIAYEDLETGNVYEFITNSLKYAPGIIAHIYRKRWDIEKRFDQTENKQHEDKAWTKSRTGKLTQARLTALANNLMLLFHHKMENEKGITESKVEERFEKRLLKRIDKALSNGRMIPMLTVILRVKPTQITLQFIRWLRRCIQRKRPLSAEMGPLRNIMEAYI